MRLVAALILPFTVAAAVALAGANPASAASACRDGKGKFVKCPPPAAAKAPVRCKDAKGKFAKCSAAGAKPV